MTNYVILTIKHVIYILYKSNFCIKHITAFTLFFLVEKTFHTHKLHLVACLKNLYTVTPIKEGNIFLDSHL